MLNDCLTVTPFRSLRLLGTDTPGRPRRCLYNVGQLTEYKMSNIKCVTIDQPLVYCGYELVAYVTEQPGNINPVTGRNIVSTPHIPGYRVVQLGNGQASLGLDHDTLAQAKQEVDFILKRRYGEHDVLSSAF